MRIRYFWRLCVLIGLLFSSAVAANETEIEIAGPEGPLKGIMHFVTGQQSTPTILIIPGSGPTDRDGNNPLGNIRAATYQYLANELADQNIQSLRIDKRGLFSSQLAISNPNQVTLDDYAADIKNWVQKLKEITDASCIWLLGHSEGGLVAIQTVLNHSEDICGIILAATPGQKMADILRHQLKGNPANKPLIKTAFQAIQSLEAGQKIDVSHLHPALQQLFAPSIQDYLINLMAFDPQSALAKYSGPVLILQGDKDLQVGKKEGDLLIKANQRARLVILKNTNHILKQVDSLDPAQNYATYQDPDLPLANGVSKAIIDFISGPRTD